MSSAVLYLAIVAIWALYLIPAWIRRPHDTELDSDEETEDGVSIAEAETDTAVVAGPEDGATPAQGRPDSGHSDNTDSAFPEYRSNVHQYADSGDYAAASPRSAQSGSRRQMLRARRRMLVILLSLTALAGGGYEQHFVPWWACIPPAVMLLFYVGLLREIAKADAERAAWFAQAHAQRMAAWRRHQAQLSREQGPTAQIIDISARMGDQLYDQYADAAVRAVGD